MHQLGGRRWCQWNRRLAVVAAVGLLLSVIAAVPADAEANLRLTMSVSRPMMGETFKVGGTLATAFQRPVVLQRKVSGKWSEVARGTSGSTGQFALTYAVRATTQLRIVAPQTTYQGHKWVAITSTTSTVTPVKQQAVLHRPSNAYAHKVVPVSVAFTPARGGRPVTVQVRQGGRWITAATAVQDSNGRARLPLTLLRSGTFSYRAVTGAWHGAAQAASAATRVTVKADPTKVRKTARPLTAAEGRTIDRVTASTIEFGADAPASVDKLTKGQLVTVPPRAGFATGLLRKVAAVKHRHGKVVLTTVDASLPDVISDTPTDAPQLAMQIESQQFIPAAGVRAQVRDQSVSVDGRLRAQGVPSLTVSVNKELRSKDAAVKVTLSGSVKLEPTVDVKVDIHRFKTKGYRVGVGLKATSTIKAKVGTNPDLAKHEFDPVTLGHLKIRWRGFAGAVPVWVDGGVDVIWENSVQASAQLESEIAIDSTPIAVGVENIPGTLSPRVYQTLPKVTAKALTAGVTGKFTSFLGSKFALTMYSVAGPSMKVGGQFERTATLKVADPPTVTCESKAGPLAEVSLESSDLLKKITKKEVKLKATLKWDAYTNHLCPGQEVYPTITTLTLPQATPGMDYDQTLRVKDSRDGKWKVTSGLLPQGLKLDGKDGKITGRPTAGPTTFTVTFTDLDGNSDSQDYTIAVDGWSTASTWKSIYAGNVTACAVRDDGSGWCWGFGGAYGLGNGQVGSSNVPVRVAGDHRWTRIAAGTASCGIDESHGLWCWGANGVGEAGAGDEASTVYLPSRVGAAGTRWTEVVTGQNSACALRADQTMWCWGWGGDGNLGNGSTFNRKEPVQVAPGSHWTQISIGNYTTCGLRTDNSAWCWGSNRQGSAGDGTTTFAPAPRRVSGAADWKSISAGDRHSCGIRTNGTAWCWGANRHGELGDGTTVERHRPNQIGTGRNWADIRAGSVRTCGRTTDSKAWCWGNVNVGYPAGTLGNGSAEGSTVPVQVAGGNWRAVDAGGTESCGIRSDGIALCWGVDQSGNLGSGVAAGTVQTTPVQILG